MSALVRGLELTELSSSGAATESAAAPTTDSTAAVSTALTAAQPSLHTLQKIRFITQPDPWRSFHLAVFKIIE